MAAAVLAAATGGHLVAQAPATAAPASPAFDVVSIKQNTQGVGGPTMLGIQPGGRFTATNVPAIVLIRDAYQIQNFQLVGAPPWLTTDRFDISAKAPAGIDVQRPNPDPHAPPGPMQLMMRALLADRFKLRVHNESRNQPIYTLVIARKDGRLGPKLTKSATDCAAAMARGRSDAPPQMPAFGQPMTCGMRMGPGTFSAGSATLAQVASSLSTVVNRTVVDRTGLAGNFDVDLTYTPDQMPAARGLAPPGAPAPPAIDPNGPSIYTAIEEQLGLKLDSTRASVDVLVIDNVEPPTPD
jgi:uncharacterized protein (TIGR03435 family)